MCGYLQSTPGELVHHLTPSQFSAERVWITNGTKAMDDSTLALQSDFGEDSTTIFVDLETGVERFRVQDGYGHGGEPSVYLRDNIALLAGQRTTTDALLVDVTSGNEIQRFTFPDELHGQLMWPGLSEDKAFVFAWEDKTTLVFDLQTGIQVNRYDLSSVSNLAFSDEFIVTRTNHEIDRKCMSVDIKVLAADTGNEVFSTSVSTASSNPCGFGIGVQGNAAVISVASSDLDGIDAGPLYVLTYGNDVLGDFSQNGTLDVGRH